MKFVTRGSFDAILKKYELTDPALHELARMVRGADTADRQLTPEFCNSRVSS